MSYADSTDSGSGVASYSASQTFSSLGLHNYSGKATDNAGNESALTSGSLKVDDSNPVVSAALSGTSATGTDGNTWYKDSVTVTVSASDTGSGLKTNPSGTHSFTSSGTFAAQTAEDNVGHTASTSAISYLVDAANPTFGSCVGGPFALGSGTKTVTITAQDADSGIESSKSILSGTVDTSTATQKSVTFKAVDNVGHEVTKTCTYDIASTSFHAPINGPSVLNVAKAGRVIPVKVELFLNGTSEVKTGTVTLTTSSTTSGATTTDALETYEDTAAMSGGQFVWDASGDRWMYNLNTSGMALGEYRGNVYLNGKLAGYFLFKLAK